MRRPLQLLAVLALAVTVIVIPAAMAATPAEKLRKEITIGGIVKHLEALQEIADQNGGTRASITEGYRDSVDYVVEQLEGTGYDVTVQPFTFQFVGETAPSVFERITPTPRVYVTGAEYRTMDYSGSGNVTATIRPVDVIVPAIQGTGSTSGCEDSDFTAAGFQAGEIALLQRGTCPFRDKAQNAKEAGAVAVIVMNSGQAGQTDTLAGTLSPPIFDRPVIGTSYQVGADLVELWRSNPNVTVHIFVQTVAEDRTSYNVIAESTCGDPNNVDMTGAHLDSVFAGPGINDNGSGSAQLLEQAIQLADRLKVNRAHGKCWIQNKVRFAWWGAEEQGLVGSRYYTANLTPVEREKIDLYLNQDMNGSVNYVRFVGQGSVGGPPGSDDIERVYQEYFASEGLATDPTAFDNRSDYAAFTTPYNIPSGFLFTGAEGTKTPAQAATYGGTAGAPYDPCYHQACDTIENVNRTVLLQMAHASASVLMCFATSAPLDNGTGGPAPGTCFGKQNNGNHKDRGGSGKVDDRKHAK
jgi:Zn-dependent M28 family amino/carboxypeptidase